jgi:hypothetical protein
VRKYFGYSHSLKNKRQGIGWKNIARLTQGHHNKIAGAFSIGNFYSIGINTYLN